MGERVSVTSPVLHPVSWSKHHLLAPPFGLAKPSASSTIRANRNCRRNSRLNGGPCGDGALARPAGGEPPHPTPRFLLPRWDGTEEESKPVSVEFGIR